MPERRSSRRSGRSASGGGLGHVAKAEKQQKKRAAARERKWLRLEDGDEVVLRMFPSEEFFKDGFIHRVPMDIKGSTRHVDVMCLDQDDDGEACPGCKDELPRRYKFWSPVIVRGGGDDGDAVMIWSSGITNAKRLNKMAGRHDLAKRDIVVARSGSTKDDTEYDIDWEDDEDSPYSRDDKKLLENAPDLTRYTQVRDYDDFYKSFGDSDDDGDVGEQARQRNPFSKKRKKEDNDDDDRPKLRRRSTTKPSVRKRRG